MSAVSQYTTYNLLGWHTQQSAFREGLYADEESPFYAVVYNLATASAIIPIWGAAMGISKIQTACRMGENFTLGARIYLIVRGIFEIFCLGIVFIVPDIIVSIDRHLCSPEPNSIDPINEA